MFGRLRIAGVGSEILEVSVVLVRVFSFLKGGDFS